jgi:HlyD family secretion protein
MKLTRAKVIVATAGVLVVVAAAFALRPKALVVDTSIVARRDLETTIDADGRTRVRQRYVVVAPVAGRLTRITRVEGASVRAGDVVARLTPLPLDSQATMQAQARLDGASALVRGAAADVRVATANLDQRRRELSRAKSLAEVGGVAPRILEESELALVQAEEALRAATERARAAEADARQARAVLFAREGNGAATVLVRAPASGRILRVPERSERIVAAGATLLELGDPASLEIVVDVLSSDGATIHAGDRVRLAEWASDSGEHMNPVIGHVREIEPAGFTKVSALGVEEQRVRVLIDIDSPPEQWQALGDGYRVTVRVITQALDNVTLVPASALFPLPANGKGESAEVPNAMAMFTLEQGRARLRPVEVAARNSNVAWVRNGAHAGETVIVYAPSSVHDGARVKARVD